MSERTETTPKHEEGRKLLEELVAIPSPTGEEAAAAERLAAFFEEQDREVWIDDVGNVRAPADDSVLLTSHVDTVPGDIPVRVESTDNGGEELWGRGSVDATGPLVAMAVAAVETGVSFVGVVGEETDSRGARHLVADREAPDAVVNGEPSGWDGVTLGYRGFQGAEYTVNTDSAHTSRPEPNAIQNAISWWSRVEDAFASEDEREDGSADKNADADSESGDEATGPETPVFEQVTAKPVAFEGGTAADGLSVGANADVQFRIPPGSTADEIRETVEAEVESGTVSWREAIPPVMESPRTEVGRAFRVGIRGVGGDPRLLRKTGTSDMNLFAGAWDCPMATYGPGDSDLDHAPNEHLDLAEFDRSIAVLKTVCEDLQE